MIGILFLAFNTRLKIRELSIGALAFLIPYLMISKFIFGGGEIFGERWMYLPSVGISMIVAYVVIKMIGSQKIVVTGIMIILLSTYGFVIFVRNQVWLNDRNLSVSMILSAPESVQGYVGMAHYFMRQGKVKEAKTYMRKGSSIYPDHPPLLHVSGRIALLEHDYAQAEKSFLRAIKVRPDLPANYAYYAAALAKEGRYEKSIEIGSEFIKKYPRDRHIKFIMAENYYRLGQMEEARKYFDFDNRLTEEQKIKALDQF